MKQSDEVLEGIFQVACLVDRGIISRSKGADNLAMAYQLNRNSAKMAIRSLRHLINGERYRRALTLDATDHFLRRIREEYGDPGHHRALSGLSAHIEYRHSTGVAVPGLEALLTKHSR